jgi:hypothetical protein
MSKSAIQLKQGKNAGAGSSRQFQSVSETAFNEMKSHLIRSGTGFEQGDARKTITLEGMGETDFVRVNNALDGLSTALGTIAQEAYTLGQRVDAEGKPIESKHTQAQVDAAALALAYASDPASFFKTAGRRAVSMEEGEVMMKSPIQSLPRLKESMEAYDEKENRNAALYSATFNMMAAHQDEFGEAFFPTVVVPVDQAGYTIATRITRVINDIRRDPNGDPQSLNAKNIVQAVIDASILRNDITMLYPVVRDDSAKYFVDAGDVAPYNVELDGNPLLTAPLKMGVEFSLLNISQSEIELAKGVQDITDSVDPAMYLKALYIKLGTGNSAEVIKILTQDLPLSAFNYSVQDNYRDVVLNFKSKRLTVNSKTKKADGTDSTLLAPLATGELNVRLGLRVNGDFNTQTGNGTLSATPVTVQLVTKAGQSLALDAGEGKTAADIFAGATVIGYDLDARRTNSNLRNRGQLLDNTWQYQTYPLPIGAPISILHPMSQSDANDAAELSSLITAARITTSNHAVTALLRARDALASFVVNDDGFDDNENKPQIFGAASLFVKPHFKQVPFDAEKVVDSLKSQERARDVQEALVNVLRSEIYQAYRDSGYKAAADARAGGPAPTPTVIIGTDPVIARWLMVTGDLRLIGPDFNVKVVSTLDTRMKGKIFMSFGNFDGTNQGVPDFLHFGNMGWRPELVLTLPISRNNQISKELVVQPSFLHVPNLPILIQVDVTNIETVVENKVSVNTVDVTPAP